MGFSPVFAGGAAGVNTGFSMTMGPSSNIHSIQSAFSNPAMHSLLVGSDQACRFSYFPSLGINAEFGDVANFSDDLDELIDIIDDSSSTDDSVAEVLERFNTTLVNMGNSGYLKSTVGFGLPLPTMVHRSERLGACPGTRVLSSGVRF